MPFPSVLSPFLTNTRPIEIRELNAKLDESTSREFLLWEKTHKDLVGYSPKLTQIKKVIQAREKPDNKIASFVDQLFYTLSVPVSGKPYFCENVEKYGAQFLKKFSFSDLRFNVDLIKGYFEIGLLTPDQVFSALISTIDLNAHYDDGLRSRPSLFKPSDFQEAIPLIEILPPNIQIKVLQLLDKGHRTPLHYPEVLNKAIPLLKTLSFDQLLKLLSIRIKHTYKNKEIEIPIILKEYELLKEMYPQLFESLPYDQFLILFIIANSDLVPKYNGSLIKYETVTPQQIASFLSLENFNGKRVGDVLFANDKFIACLKNMDLELLTAYFSAPYSNGNCILHHGPFFLKAIPFLEKMNDYQLVKALSVTNDKGITPLQCFVNYVRLNKHRISNMLTWKSFDGTIKLLAKSKQSSTDPIEFPLRQDFFRYLNKWKEVLSNADEDEST